MGNIYLFDEIWVIVFDYLKLRDVYQCMQMSRRWCELATLRLKSDTSLLKKWHETDRILHFHKKGFYQNKTKWLAGSSSIFLDDVGLLVICQNDFDRIKISFYSINDNCVEHTLCYFHRWDDHGVIFHYHKTEQRLIVHLKVKDGFFSVLDIVIDLSDLNNLEPQYIKNLDDNVFFGGGRCQLCEQIFRSKPKILLPPSPSFYENHTALVFVNEPTLLRVGCILGDNSMNIFENGIPSKNIPSLPRTEAKVVDSEHIFAYPLIINIKTGVRNVVGLSEADEFYQVGPYLLNKSSDGVWKIVKKQGDDWEFSDLPNELLSHRGHYPAFCQRENRILLF